MLTSPMEVLKTFPVRKNKKQKQAFRGAVQSYAEKLGYKYRIEKGSLGVHNVVIGDPSAAKYLITAHYDTPARMLFPNLITPCNLWAFLGYQILTTLILLLPPVVFGIALGALFRNVWLGEIVYFLLLFAQLYLLLLGPANPNTANDNTSGVVSVLEIMRSLSASHRDKVCFVLFDLEEAGLLGSSAYRKAHKKETEAQIVLNLDCVGDGDEIMFFPNRKYKQDKERLDLLKTVSRQTGNKRITVHEKGFSVYPSDQKNFPYGVGVAAFQKHRIFGLYCSRIHTARDTVLEEANVNMLCSVLTELITSN